MSSNPLVTTDGKTRSGTVTREMIEGLVVRLNHNRFVRETGNPYYVGKHDAEGETYAILSR